MKKTKPKTIETTTSASLIALPDSLADARQHLLLQLYNLGMQDIDKLSSVNVSATKAFLDFTLDLENDAAETGLTTEQAMELLRLHLAENRE